MASELSRPCFDQLNLSHTHEQRHTHIEQIFLPLGRQTSIGQKMKGRKIRLCHQKKYEFRVPSLGHPRPPITKAPENQYSSLAGENEEERDAVTCSSSMIRRRWLGLMPIPGIDGEKMVKNSITPVNKHSEEKRYPKT